eukprot:m.14163 g.14163  ORF g.14163 m.14163 type:complete len:2985 (-) comp3348_c0_seq1:299-9253(-)
MARVAVLLLLALAVLSGARAQQPGCLCSEEPVLKTKAGNCPPYDVMFLVDDSIGASSTSPDGSVTRWQSIQSLLQDIIARYFVTNGGEDTIAIAQFSTTFALRTPSFTNNQTLLQRTVTNMRPSLGTQSNLGLAVQQTLEFFDNQPRRSPGVVRVIFILTDGPQSPSDTSVFASVEQSLINDPDRPLHIVTALLWELAGISEPRVAALSSIYDSGVVVRRSSTALAGPAIESAISIEGCSIAPTELVCRPLVGYEVLRSPAPFFEGTCAPCQQGEFQNEPAQQECKTCSSGTYQDQLAQTLCKSCQFGHYQDETATVSCKECAPGEFQNELGMAGCKSCPVGTFTTLPAQRLCTQWSVCPAGQQAALAPSATADRTCVACSPGTANPSEGSTCSPCGPGEYQNEAGQQACKPCPSGSFQDESGQLSCKSCDAGLFQDQSGQSECKACPDNEYQPAGGQARCLPCSECSAGEFRAGGCSGVNDRLCDVCTTEDDCRTSEFLFGECDPLSSTDPFCVSCHATCASCEGPNATPCATCPPGWVLQVDGTCSQGCGRSQFLNGNGVCTPCHESCLTCSGPGSDECLSCENPATGSDKDPEEHLYLLGNECIADCSDSGDRYKDFVSGICWPCRECSVGQRRARDCSEFQNAACVACIEGTTYQDELNVNACKPVSSCPAGQEQAAAPTTSTDRTCRVCPEGEYQDVAGLLTCKSVKSCDFATQFQTAEPTPTSDRQCQALTTCDVGEELFAAPTEQSDRVCRPCNPGFFQDTPDQNSCKRCPSGTYQNEAGQTSCKAVSVCKVGEETAVVPTDVNDRVCSKCTLGHYQNEIGQPTCKRCLAGSISRQPGATICAACSAGTFQDELGQNECKACASGRFTALTGQTRCQIWRECVAGEAQSRAPTSTSDRLCAACPIGEFQNRASQTSCIDCSQGQFQNERGQTTCKSCPAGQYQDELGEGACIACPAGTFQSESGQSRCLPCPDGTYQNELGKSSCKAWTPCSVGEEVDVEPTSLTNRICRSCSFGFYQNEAGQDTCKRCTVNCAEGLFRSKECTTTANAVCSACRECSSGTYITGGCVAASDRICSACTRASECAPGLYLSGVCDPTSVFGPTCVSCHATCQTCGGVSGTVGPLPCTTCPTGWVKLSDGTCASNCPARQYRDLNGVCQACHSSCQACSGPGSNQCLACDNPSTGTSLPVEQHTYLLNGLCVSDCHTTGEYYKVSTTGRCMACTACAAGSRRTLACSEFQNAKCVSCVQDLTYQPLPRQTTCLAVTTCTEGQELASAPTFTSDRVCRACSSGFFQNQPGQTECKRLTSCEANVEYQVTAPTLTSDRACLELRQCSAGQETDVPATLTTDRTCRLCSAGSFQDEPARASCKSCPLGTYQELQGQTGCNTCTPECPEETFISSTCTPFHDLECTTCRQCEAGQYIIGGCEGALDRVCSPCLTRADCAVNEFLVGSCDPRSTQGPTCETCHPSCESCDGPTALPCATCARGLVKLLDGSCGTTCAAGQYVDGDQCRECHVTCASCTGPEANQCTTCHNEATQTTRPKANYRYLLNGVCSRDCHLDGVHYKNTELGICDVCDRCGSGTRISSACAQFQDAQCENCLLGSTYLDEPGMTECKAVSVCGAGEFTEMGATRSSDRVCTPCPAGTFQDEIGQASCKPWSVCDAGFVEEIAPTIESDRVCRRQCFCPAQVDACSFSERQEIVFLVDGSESVSRRNFALTKTFINQTLQTLHLGDEDRVAFAEFSDTFTQVSDAFRDTYSAAHADLTALSQSFGLTFTATAMTKTLSFIELLGRVDPDVTTNIVLITDGQTSAADQTNIEAALTQLTASNVHVIAIGLGPSASYNELLRYSLNVPDNVRISTYANLLSSVDLTSMLAATRVEVCQETVGLVECSCTTTTPVPTTESVAETTTPGFVLDTTTPMIRTTTEECLCSDESGCEVEDSVHVLFLLDGSAHMTSTEFTAARNFVSTMGQRLLNQNKGHMLTVAEFSTDYMQPTPTFAATSTAFASQVAAITKSGGQQSLAGEAMLEAYDFLAAYQTSNATHRVNLAVVVVTKTLDDSNSALAEGALALHDLEALVFAIGVNSEANTEALGIIAQNESDRVFQASSAAALSGAEFVLAATAAVASACDAHGTLPCACPTEECFCPTVLPCEPIQNKDIVFVVDGSESVGEDDFARIKTFLGTLMDRLMIDDGTDRVAFIEYSHTVTVWSSSFATTQARAESDLASVEQSFGVTYTGTALLTAVSFLENHQREDAQGMIVVLTDGRTSVENQDELAAAISALRNTDIAVIALGLGRLVDESELLEMTNDADRVFPKVEIADLSTITDALTEAINDLCADITTMAPCFCPENDPRDIFFLVDGSESMANDEFAIFRSFIVSAIGALNVAPKNSSVAMAEFSSEFTLVSDHFTNRESTGRNWARQLEQSFGVTMTGSALHSTLDFLDAHARSESRPIIVLFTDGKTSPPDQANLATAIERLRSSGVSVVIVGIGSQVNNDELESITDDPTNIILSTFSGLPQTMPRFLRLVRELTLVSPTSALPTTHPATTSVPNNGGSTTTTTTSAGGPTTTTTTTTTQAGQVTTLARSFGTYAFTAAILFSDRSLSNWGPFENQLVKEGVAAFLDIDASRVTILSNDAGSVVVGMDVTQFPTEEEAQAAKTKLENGNIPFDSRLGSVGALTAAEPRSVASTTEDDSNNDNLIYALIGVAAFVLLIFCIALILCGCAEYARNRRHKYELEAEELKVYELQSRMREHEEQELRYKRELERKRQAEARAAQEMRLHDPYQTSSSTATAVPPPSQTTQYSASPAPSQQPYHSSAAAASSSLRHDQSQVSASSAYAHAPLPGQNSTTVSERLSDDPSLLATQRRAQEAERRAQQAEARLLELERSRASTPASSMYYDEVAFSARSPYGQPSHTSSPERLAASPQRSPMPREAWGGSAATSPSPRPNSWGVPPDHNHSVTFSEHDFADSRL